MAKKRGNGGARRDRFVNRYRGRLSFAGNSTTCVSETFNTGMNVGRENPSKWVIMGFAVWPNQVTFAQLSGAGQAMVAQLAIGTQTAVLNGDDMQVIAEAHATSTETSSGVESMVWPLKAYLPSPIPVFAQSLTVLLDAAADNANLQSKEFVYQIDYVMAGMAPDEMMEYLAAFGQV